MKVSKYRNGDTIPTGLNNWASTTSGAYAIYNSNPVNDGLYGKLYNHYAVTDSRGLCPTGWHVPTDGEWNFLVKYLDANADTTCYYCMQLSNSGGMLKSIDFQPIAGGWNSPNTGANNFSGFTGRPGGLRNGHGYTNYENIGVNGYWWTTSFSGAYPWYRLLYHNSGDVRRDVNHPTCGFSVRCLKD
ncbi:MAG: hypothetical protein EBX50_16140 [Chitinophagia bacterium]|nr:hypothetical protein [Chitinophagia bacterium]